MLTNSRNSFVSAGSLALLASVAAAAPAYPAANGEFDYPELLVTPRASERIATESGQEASRRWTTLIPEQVSALGTLTAGIIQSQGDTSTLRDVDSGKVGIGVGTALLAASFAI